MVAALDVHYKSDGAKSVVVLFDKIYCQISKSYSCTIKTVEDYVSGQFYKRELPCLMEVLKQVDLTTIDFIIIDGYVYTDNIMTYGLGAHLWSALNKKIPVVGVAKSKFYNNIDNIIEVYRGSSKNPIFVSSIGLDLRIAADYIKKMPGLHRVPNMLKELDRLTKS